MPSLRNFFGRLPSFGRFRKTQKPRNFKQEIRDWLPERRIERAEEIIKHLTHQMDAMLQRQATNDLVVYSETISSQIPRSRAAIAFNLLRNDLHSYAIIRLLAVWDPPEDNALSIPTAILLLDNDDVIDELQKSVHDDHANVTPYIADEEDDPLTQTRD